ncbi:MAG: aminoacyl-tRNA hydrolase [Bacteroidota bacterium]
MAAKVDWLFAGLGNPGDEYKSTRHNIGWMVAAEYARVHNKPMMAFHPMYYHSALRYRGQLIMTIMPVTFMNLSGKAIKDVANSFDIPPSRIVTIVDEYNFEAGKVKLRQGGSDGGHNGIASVINELGTENFLRLRCGIGRDFGPGGLVDYVLSDFTEEELQTVDKMIKKAIKCLDHLAADNNTKRAMSYINSGQLFEPAEESKKPAEDKDESPKAANRYDKDNISGDRDDAAAND